MNDLKIGDRITAGEGDDRGSGVVLEFVGNLITIAWDSGVKTTTSREALGIFLSMIDRS